MAKAIDYYLIEVDDSYENLYKKDYGSLEYYLPETAIEDKGVFPQRGKIHSLKKGNPLSLKEGQEVLIHQTLREQKLSEGLYWSKDTQLLAVIDGKETFMLNGMLMVDKIQESTAKSPVIEIVNNDFHPTDYIVRHTTRNSQLRVGQRVCARENTSYSIKSGKDTFVMIDEQRHVQCYYDNEGMMQPINSWVMVEKSDINEVKKNGSLYLPEGKINAYPQGVIHRLPHKPMLSRVLSFTKKHYTDLKVGQEVFFIAREDGRKEENGVNYYFARVDEYEEIILIK